MSLLRLSLFLGLVFHKVVWELMKRETASRETIPARPSTALKAIKSTKILALGVLLAQTLFLEILPISKNPKWLKRVGVGLFAAGLAIAISGRVRLGTNWSNIEDARVADTHRLVTDGIYRYSRHPIYVGDLLLVLGLELALNSWPALLVVLPMLFSIRQIAKEELLLAERHPEYQAYRARTKRFVPWLV